jgi:multimeric flavodoxin WrbA
MGVIGHGAAVSIADLHIRPQSSHRLPCCTGLTSTVDCENAIGTSIYPIGSFKEKQIMPTIIAVYGSPRRTGNTAALLKHAVAGAVSAGAAVEEIVLRDLRISPCLEIYACKDNGQCAIKDDFAEVRDRLLAADALIFASPIFFYAVSAHLKALMDRCQSLWVKKYWLSQTSEVREAPLKDALFISVGATRGKKLFDGVLLSMQYFLEVLDARLWQALLVRGVDHSGDIFKHPEQLEAAYKAGRQLAQAAARTTRAV